MNAEAVQESNSPGLRYQRLLQLGSGGMATVHLALATGQNDFSRLVVVKAVREGNAAIEELRKMFLSEARLSARLNHPNVVQVSEVVESGESVMLVMEYLDGLSLAETYLAAPNGFTLAMRLRVLCEVLIGLHYAHELTDYEGQPLGIVHRDVSPQNVFLTFDGRVKLLDFGIAKATTLANRDETREGVVKGRVAYMPVEQFAREETDRRADVYAVGCMIWEAVAGTRMWGKASDVEILQSVWAGELPKVADHVDVDDELAAIVDRATAHKAQDRYPTAEALRRDLEAYLKQLPPASARDVGQFLSEVCAEQRQKKQRLVAEAIARAKGQTSTGPVSSGSLRSLVSPTSADTTRSATLSVSARRRPWMLALMLLVLAGIFIAFAPQFSNHQRHAATPSPPEAKPAMAALMVHPTPKDAVVYLDGKPLTGDPPQVEVPVGSRHELRVERTGYQSAKRSVLVTRDTDLEVALHAEPQTKDDAEVPEKPVEKRVAPSHVRRAVPVLPQPRKVAAPSSAAPSKPPARASAPSCDPPFFFDQGIKTYKPECI